MRKKKKKVKVNKTIPYQLKRKKSLLKQLTHSDYSKLFQTLSAKDFINFIFHTPFVAIHYSRTYVVSYISVMNRMNSIVNFFHEVDLYSYFDINHSLHEHLDKYGYTNAIFRVITDLHSQVLPDENYVSELEDKEFYVFVEPKHSDNSVINFCRELFYYGYSPRDLKNVFWKGSVERKLLEIHQSDFHPIDISQKSYLF
jgi:hypothetical protein